MRRDRKWCRSTAAIAIALWIPGCVLDFDGLTGGETTPDGTGLCGDTCTGGACAVVADVADPQLPIARVAGSSDGIFFGDPQAQRLGLLTRGGLASVDTPVGPYAVAVTSDQLFFASQSQGIFACGLPTCDTVAELVPMGPDTFARALTSDGEQLFWIVGPDISTGGVFRCAVDACIPEAVAMSQNRPHALVVDDAFVYWTVHGGGGAADGLIRRAPKTGGAAIDYLAGLVAPSGLALGTNALVFTQASLDGDVWRCERGADACGPPTKITNGPRPVDTPFAMPASVVVHADRAYWTNDGAATVMSCPLDGCSTDGGTPTIVANDVPTPRSIAISGGCLAWSAAPGIFATAL